VTSLLATQRLQDGFALANFRFDSATRRVLHDGAGGPEKQNPSITRFVVLRDGVVYFEGEPQELAETRDPYLQRFLI